MMHGQKTSKLEAFYSQK